MPFASGGLTIEDSFLPHCCALRSDDTGACRITSVEPTDACKIEVLSRSHMIPVEVALPVEIDRELETIGPFDFGGIDTAFTAHGKIDPVTGELLISLCSTRTISAAIRLAWCSCRDGCHTGSTGAGWQIEAPSATARTTRHSSRPRTRHRPFPGGAGSLLQWTSAGVGTAIRSRHLERIAK
jgi:hypothetical protein